MMKREFRDKWIEDLEKNGHLKIEGQLRFGTEGNYKYCALGRACTIGNIGISDNGLETLPTNPNINWKPLRDIGINTFDIYNKNDNGKDDGYAEVIQYLKSVEVED